MTRPAIAALALATALLGPVAPARAQRDAKPPATLYDPRLGDLRRATVSWDARPGPSRKVVDQVCLVPDLATFLAALATWDREHWFPILLDDSELDLKFARAFRPSRVVRFPRAAPAIPPERLWSEALAAVGRSWAMPGAKGEKAPSGAEVPADLGPTPPGVVVSHPESPALAGAAALAAGRFQPLIRWDSAKTHEAVLSVEEGDRYAFELEARVIAAAPKHADLGDDCDFITLAGDYPYRAKLPAALTGGVGCFDDRVARSGKDRRRWAFTGRLIGDPARSVYRAMCSLFLRPESALLFNAYDEGSEPWREYAMDRAERRLAPVLPTTLRSGPERAGLSGWYDALHPVNRRGLLLINTHGGPTLFNLQGGAALTGDVPATEPAAVVMIHSFSAADPYDAATIAGRWLANGAFAYFGSVHEPYLQSFRTPSLVADLVAEGLPLGAAVRQGAGEPFGFPWRLIYLGDPLFRPRPTGRPDERLKPETDWPAFQVYRTPGPDDPDETRLRWALKAALALAGQRRVPAGVDLPGALLAIRRDRIGSVGRKAFDGLLVDVLMRSGRFRSLRQRLRGIPADEVDGDVRRWLETACMADLHSSLEAGDLPGAADAWADLVRSGGSSDELKGAATRRVGRAADSPDEQRAWRDRLASALPKLGGSGASETVRDELRRVEKKLGSARGG